jgi:hypothetical protein
MEELDLAGQLDDLCGVAPAPARDGEVPAAVIALDGTVLLRSQALFLEPGAGESALADELDAGATGADFAVGCDRRLM